MCARCLHIGLTVTFQECGKYLRRYHTIANKLGAKKPGARHAEKIAREACANQQAYAKSSLELWDSFAQWAQEHAPTSEGHHREEPQWVREVADEMKDSEKDPQGPKEMATE